MDRFDNFLSRYLDIYLSYVSNGLIQEIVINDENGNDWVKLNQKYAPMISSSDVLRVYRNEKTLGPFLNKLKVCNYAKNEYIVLMDSDNFANDDYFIKIRKYIYDNITTLPEYFILSPSFAKPRFNYKLFENKIIKRNNINIYKRQDSFATMMNTGNYLMTKNIVNKIIPDTSISGSIHSADVIYFNTLCFYQIENFEFHILENLEYEHIVHNNSCYIINSSKPLMNYNAQLAHQMFYNI